MSGPAACLHRHALPAAWARRPAAAAWLAAGSVPVPGHLDAGAADQRDPGVFLADTARVLGRVELHAGVSIWPGAALRGDVAEVVIGPGTNVQDNATVHCDAGRPNVIGAGVTIGHNAVVHGRAVGDGSLIGMHATVLGGAVIGKGCLVAAGALVPPGMEVPDGMAVIGVPGKILRPVSAAEKAYLDWLPVHYNQLAARHADAPADPAVVPWSPPAG